MSGPAPRTSAIVLAGGRSSRYGANKLGATIGGRTLLERAHDAVAAVCDEVLVVASAGGPLPDLQGARVVRDAAPYPGPLVALAEGARHAAGERLLVVGGDMPFLVPDVLRLLLGGVSPGVPAVTLELGQPLPIALERQSALDAAVDLLGRGERSLRALARALDARVLPLDCWQALDPEGRTRRDVDRPGDLGPASTA
jgi:molybdopterin-guanine dinucleotide biosynthesis protein A